MSIDEDVETFIKDSGVDDRAADALRAEDEKVQRAVIDRGEMTDCRNPSASLMSRIRVAKESSEWSGGQGAAMGGGKGGGGLSKGPTQDELEAFLTENGIDDQACAALREATPAIQRTVLDRGSLTDCRNPSAVCLARIRDAKAGATASSHAPAWFGAGPAAFGGCGGCCGGFGPYGPGFGAGFGGPAFGPYGFGGCGGCCGGFLGNYGASQAGPYGAYGGGRFGPY